MNYISLAKAMERKKRKIVRSTNSQIKFLVDHMLANPCFATGELAAEKFDEEWAALADVLSNYGPHKSVEQWKHTWRDLKKRAREEGSKVHLTSDTIGYEVPVPEISEQSQKILDAIRHECEPSEPVIDSKDGLLTLYPMTCDVSQQSANQWSQPTEDPIRSEPTLKRENPIRRPRRRLSQPLNKTAPITKTLEKTNKILEELRKEVAKSNELRTEQLKFMQQIASTLNRSSSCCSSKMPIGTRKKRKIQNHSS